MYHRSVRHVNVFLHRITFHMDAGFIPPLW